MLGAKSTPRVHIVSLPLPDGLSFFFFFNLDDSLFTGNIFMVLNWVFEL